MLTKEDFLRVPEDRWDEFASEEVLDFILTNNDPTWVRLKTAEELIELGEVIIKSITKSEKHKPSDDDIIGEYRDVLFRLALYARLETKIIDEDEGAKLNVLIDEKIASSIKSILNRKENASIPVG